MPVKAANIQPVIVSSSANNASRFMTLDFSKQALWVIPKATTNRLV